MGLCKIDMSYETRYIAQHSYNSSVKLTKDYLGMGIEYPLSVIIITLSNRNDNLTSHIPSHYTICIIFRLTCAIPFIIIRQHF